MATYAHSVRRGLPRVPGGEPWPPAGSTPATVGVAATVEAASTVGAAAEPTRAVAPEPEKSHEASDRTTGVRTGLPRTPGGEPWPPVTAAEHEQDAATPASTAPEPTPTDQPRAAETPVRVLSEALESAASASEALELRRGLPRAPGGDAWPPAGTAPVSTPAAHAPADPTPLAPADSEPPAAASVVAESEPPAAATTERSPLVERPLAHAGVARRVAPRPAPRRHGPFTAAQWAGIVVLGGAAVLYVAAMAVIAVRWLLSLEPLQDFLTTYPGEYHLPEGAPVGFPAWLNWSHFLNAFFMVLIIRTGLQVRSEKRPSAFWISKKNRRRKMSLTLWLHQALDILWLANGILFVVLLFATGQWMRVIPTSWEVFPNALSAALQYVSLDWPTENGWVNYNSLQQLAYFTTIFVAAPLAAITGYRMSVLWPKNATKLNTLYPVEWARALHFPTMLYFVVFIVVHVALVLSTGALRNLGHMYAAQGSVDPDAYADNWTGFWLFALSIAVTVAAYVAMRPLVVAPIARLFGNVSSR
jgi:thiosulfate reductase cytochrome b subunit